MKMITFGEVLWDVYPDKACIGGAPLNFAAHTAIHGHPVHMVSAVGNDDLGTDTLAWLNEHGIDTSCVCVLTDKATGKCLVSLDDHGVPSYQLLDDVAWDAIDTASVSVENDDVLYFGTLALRHEYNRNALRDLLERTSPKEVFVDVNIRAPFYSAEVLDFAMQAATILKISDEEWNTVLRTVGMQEADIGIDAYRALASRYTNLRTLIITKGGDGAESYDVQSDTLYEAPAVSATVLSTVGAGDSFSAAFLHRHIGGDTLDGCLSYAAKIAALVVSHYDAVPDYKPF